YNHIPAGKYLSSKFVGRLFPTTFDEKRHVLRRLPAIELMRLEPFLYNRPLKPSSINSVVQSTPPLRTQPFFTLKFPVLHRVVNKALGQGVIFYNRSKGFLHPWPRPTRAPSHRSRSVCNERRQQYPRIAPLSKGSCLCLHRGTNQGGPSQPEQGTQGSPYSESKRSRQTIFTFLPSEIVHVRSSSIDH
ncbi:hypothetical protein V3C99_011522, partial [Haemonchus contortus]